MQSTASPRANRGPAAAAENRRALIAAAREVYADGGLAAPFSAVAKRAGVGQGSLYRHFPDRTALAAELMSPDSPEQEMWVPLAMFSFMAWDTGATVRTTDALAAGHPGLTTMGFAPPGPDGLWTFPEFSYGRQLAAVHPQTTASGDPA